MKNLALACSERSIEFLRIYDNSEFGKRPQLVMELRRGHPLSIADKVPAWLESALAGTRHDIGKLRAQLARSSAASRDR